MKKIVLFLTFTLLISCGSISRQLSGATEENLVKQVSVETGCPVDKIKVVDKLQTFGNASYSLDVCGKRMVYKQIGSTFSKA